jgi:hypothetical protein
MGDHDDVLHFVNYENENDLSKVPSTIGSNSIILVLFPLPSVFCVASTSRLPPRHLSNSKTNLLGLPRSLRNGNLMDGRQPTGTTHPRQCSCPIATDFNFFSCFCRISKVSTDGNWQLAIQLFQCSTCMNPPRLACCAGSPTCNL